MIIEHIHIKPKVAQKIFQKHNVTEEEVREVLFFSRDGLKRKKTISSEEVKNEKGETSRF